MTTLRLKVKQIDSSCNFELSWGNGQVIDVNLNYPFSLTTSYEQWHRAYLDYYRRLRGKVVKSGTGSTPVDRHKQLVEAEALLLYEFQRWLLSPELVSIRSKIAIAASQSSKKHPVEVFLTCTPIELARLPWEAWDIGTDLGTPEKIRIARTPANILYEPVRPFQRKVRVLAILGDDTGLNFQAEEKAVNSLRSIVDVKFAGWEKKTEKKNFDARALKTELVQKISDSRGWDVLFFAGHSNETALTGGEFGIAPGVALSMQEIEDALKIAKKRGLQFAIFNSCSGINIAEFLINLGLSQVAVMREPVHNQVAQEFLLKFLQSLVAYKDVHAALLDASQLLKQEEKRLSYPSAYLVPSLFRHPEAELFQIQPFGIASRIKRWIPTQQEAKWLVVLLFLSLLPPVQSLLLDTRILLQAVYRQVTSQKPTNVETPLVVVKIDEESIQANTYQNKKQINPIDYSYLAALVNRLSLLEAKIIGIDYILDDNKQPKNSLKLGKAVRNAVNKDTWFIFASGEGEKTRRSGVSQDIADLNWSLSGDILSYDWYLELLPDNEKDTKIYPFSYMLSLVYLLNQPSNNNLPEPNLRSKTLLQDAVLKYLNHPKNYNQEIALLRQTKLHPLTEFSEFFGQKWFQPIIDFSLPPDSAYKSISACKLVGNCEGEGNTPENLKNKIVLIIPGGYKGAGVEGKNDDNLTIPLAVAFWRGWGNGTIPGGEVHAYMVHHFLTRRFVVPVPDFLMILLAALLAKGTILALIEYPKNQKKIILIVSISSTILLLVFFQVYISAFVLVPCFFPSILFWNYIRFALRRQSNE